jgi:hypothetical protein
MNKICTKCGVEKDFTDFYKTKNICKECIGLYYKDNKEKIQQRNKEYREKNKKKILKKEKEYRDNHKEYYNEYSRKYRILHRDYFLEYSKNYREKYKNYFKNYYIVNTDKFVLIDKLIEELNRRS